MSEFELKIDEETELAILSIAKWLKFLSVLGILSIIALFSIWFYLFYIKNINIDSSEGGGASVAFIVALSMIIPSILLWISSNYLSYSIHLSAQNRLIKGIRLLKLFFVTSFIIAFSLIFFIFAGIIILN